MKQRSRGPILLLIVGVLALILASCSSSDSAGSSDGGSGSGSAATCQGKTGEADTSAALGKSGDADGKGKKIGMVFDVGGRGDKSFNDSAYAGIEAAGKNTGAEVKELEPSADGSNREALVKQLADEKYDMIITVGYAFGDALAKIAPEYPDTQFAIIDSVVDQPNVTSITFAANQGSYLVGAAAAGASKTGHIGFVGGVDSDLIKAFQAGYTAGAKAVNKDITVDVKYISTGDDTSGFANPTKGQTIAAGLYDGGADVIYHASGGSGSGVIKAAVAADRLVIGVDSNQYLTSDAAAQKCMLTSMLKRVDVGVYSSIISYLKGETMGGVKTFDLKNDGIGYATQGGQIKNVDQIDGFKTDIVDGKTTVPEKP